MITRDDWLQALDAVGATVREADQDAVTATEFGALVGLNRTTALERLKRLVGSGKAVLVTKRQADSAGRAQLVPAYRLKATGKPAKAKR